MPGLVEIQEGKLTNLGEAGQETPLCASHRHSGREGVQPDGLAPWQEEAETVTMQLFLKDNLTM